jgi:toxin ParE1/3/4
MAQVIWSERALGQLDEIAGYIALDNLSAAKDLMGRIFAETDLLGQFPNLGRKMPVLHRESYRMIWVAPCWIYYRVAAVEERVIVLHVRRAERPLRLEDMAIE